MKQVKINSIHYALSIMVLVLLLSSCTKSVKLNELTSKNGLFYLKSDTIPFSGKIQSEYISGKDSLRARVNNGLYNGDYLLYYPTGEIKDSVIYKKGKVIKFRRFCQNGSILKTPKKYLFEKNNLMYELRDKKDTVLFSGLAVEKTQGFKENKFYTYESNYFNGMQHGDQTGYYENGKIFVKSNYKNGLEEGKYNWFYENGVLGGDGNYSKNEKIGKWVTYYKNKQISDVGIYKNGQKDSTWNEYYENGKIQKKSKYANGEYNGPFEDYYDNGKLKLKGSFSHGNKDGDWTWYYSSGRVESQAKFRNGMTLRACNCCGRYYAQEEGWNARPSAVSPNLWAFMCDQPQFRGGPYCSQGCAERCR